ncbi:MAG: trypsin-like peptidase domain-containing protein [Desulfomonile tiedjei]|nr:trypsin-like peptidase domain-containing protein [Desulfomonile tiedjei]
MSDIQLLESLSAEELRAELAAREAKTKGALAMPASESLKHVTSATIVEVLRAQQKVIYGIDDRQDIWELSSADPMKSQADSVVALFEAGSITDNGNGTSSLQTTKFRTARNLCPEERFGEQPVGAFCTGFLVAPDIIATAGHCANASNVQDVRFVFGFEMENETKARLIIDNNEIYRGVNIIGRQEIASGADWALIRIDRAVTNHPVLQVRKSGKINDNQSVYVIGHPSGLPKKVAGGSAVRKNESPEFFVANTDTYGGNSGSPVFNANSHQVEGILVRGETDFVTQGNCTVSLVCPASGCRGEDCTRTSVFASLIP